jgi:hypothetical protein
VFVICVVGQDQAVFSRDLEFALKKHPLFPKNIEDFIGGFEKLCSENRNLKKVLTQTKVKQYNLSS